MKQLIGVDEALHIIEDAVQLTAAQCQSLLLTAGHYAAEDCYAPIDVPHFKNAAMDGYGIRYADLASYKRLKVIGEIPAGIYAPQRDLKGGEALRIFTGAKVPKGVDTVIKQEQVSYTDGYISLPHERVKKGANIRLKGSQTARGQLVAPKHSFMQAAVLGLLAGCGVADMAIFKPLNIGLLYTGDELVEPGYPLLEGQVFNANRYFLETALADIKQPIAYSQKVADTKKATSAALKKALDIADVVLITGGISVGNYDYVLEALAELGARPLFYKVRQKPGKPLYFGKYGDKTIFALPGNPSAVFCCYHYYVKPFLLGCVGRKSFHADAEQAYSESFVSPTNPLLSTLLKGFFHKGKVRILQGQESYKMDSAAEANCLVILPEGQPHISIGEKVRILMI